MTPSETGGSTGETPSRRRCPIWVWIGVFGIAIALMTWADQIQQSQHGVREVSRQ